MSTHERTSDRTNPLAELSAVSTGAMIRLADETVTLERVEQIEAEHSPLSPVRGLRLTRIRFRRRDGRSRRRVYPSKMLVETVRRNRTR